MSDNITLANGKIVATDDVAGVQYPISKIAYGPDGSATHVDSLAQLPAIVTPRGMDFYERMLREGEPWSVSAFNPAAVNVAAGSVNIQVTATVGIGYIARAIWLEEITLSLNVPCMAQLAIAADVNGRFTNYTRNFVCGNSPITIPVRALFRGYELTNGIIAVNVRRVFDPATGAAASGATDVYAGVTASGWRITDDFDFDAPKTIMVVGDSIVAGFAGVTATGKMWPFLAKQNFLTVQGARARIVLQATSGSASSEHETWRIGGRYDAIDADMGFYTVGANDAASAIASATYIANITAFWAWWSKRFPNKVLIICGITPLENNTYEALAATYRTAAAAYVSGVGSAYLKYINLGSAFDRTSGTTNYASTDAAGSRVHPNDTGHAAIATTFNAAIASQGITL